MNKKIYNSYARASIFTLFMLQEKEVTSKQAVQFMCDNFGIDVNNAYRLLRNWANADILERNITPGSQSVWTYKGEIPTKLLNNLCR